MEGGAGIQVDRAGRRIKNMVTAMQVVLERMGGMAEVRMAWRRAMWGGQEWGHQRRQCAGRITGVV